MPDRLYAAVAAGVMASEEDFTRLLRSIVEVARAIFGAQGSSIFLLDEDTDELVFAAVAGEQDQFLVGQRSRRPPASPAGSPRPRRRSCWRTCRPTLASHATSQSGAGMCRTGSWPFRSSTTNACSACCRCSIGRRTPDSRFRRWSSSGCSQRRLRLPFRCSRPREAPGPHLPVTTVGRWSPSWPARSRAGRRAAGHGGCAPAQPHRTARPSAPETAPERQEPRVAGLSRAQESETLGLSAGDAPRRHRRCRRWRSDPDAGGVPRHRRRCR